jgi:hypothetical protein
MPVASRLTLVPLLVYAMQFDVKTRRTFLKRTHYPALKLEDIFIGAKLTMFVGDALLLPPLLLPLLPLLLRVALLSALGLRLSPSPPVPCSYARQLQVLDYEDDFTRRSLEKEKARCCVVVKPDGLRSLGEVSNRGAPIAHFRPAVPHFRTLALARTDFPRRCVFRYGPHAKKPG